MYSGYVVALGWISNTLPRPPAKRAAALAAINAVSNTSSIYASYMYPQSAGPRYGMFHFVFVLFFSFFFFFAIAFFCPFCICQQVCACAVHNVQSCGAQQAQQQPLLGDDPSSALAGFGPLLRLGGACIHVPAIRSRTSSSVIICQPSHSNPFQLMNPLPNAYTLSPLFPFNPSQKDYLLT